MKTTQTILVALAGFAALLSTGCASYKAGAIETRDATQYGNHTTSGDIVAAADAYVTSARIEPAFYVNLADRGFYPIQIVIQNTSPNRVLLLKDRIELVDASGSAYRPVNVAAMIDEFEKNKMAYALLGFGIFSYMSADDANKKMAADWREKELANEVILNPGRRAAGFVYLKMPKGVKPSGMTLNLEVENLETKALSKPVLRL